MDLRTELRTDPLNIGYAGMDDVAVAAALNARTVPVKRPIPAADVKKQFSKASVLAQAKFYADDATNPLPLRVACQTVRDSLLFDAFTDLDPSDPDQAPLIKSFLDALQTAGCLDEAGRQAVLALADDTATRASQVGWPTGVASTDVAAARG